MSSRSRASISAGPVPGSRISSSPQSALTATKPPSLTTTTTGIDLPVEPNRRHRPRAAGRSRRASTIKMSALPASSNDETSGGAVRRAWASSDKDGRTTSGFGSAVSSNRSKQAPPAFVGKASPKIHGEIRSLTARSLNDSLQPGLSRADDGDDAHLKVRVGHNMRMRKALVGAVAVLSAVLVVLLAAVGADFGTSIYAEYRLARAVRDTAHLGFDPFVAIIAFPLIPQ